MPVLLAALVVKLLGARANLALDKLYHKLSLLPSAGFDVHFHSSLVLDRCSYQIDFYSTGQLLTESYIGEKPMLPKY